MITIDVLDHGYVTLRNLAGAIRRVDQQFDADDTDAANVARLSFDQMDSGRTREDDLRLTKYLIDHLHMTPFESIEVWLEMKLPMFLARQLVRHRTASINEVSGRYVKLPEEFYIPEFLGTSPKGGAKQGQSGHLPADLNKQVKELMFTHCANAFDLYDLLLEMDVAPEHARMILPLNVYTHWMYKMNLRNLLHMIRLRLDAHAQVEAQQYARATLELLKYHLPQLMKEVGIETS